MASVANQVTHKFFEDAYVSKSNHVVANSSWKADLLLGELIIEGAAPAPNREAEEASMALMNLISFASKKIA